MSVHLLDVNVLIALSWPTHEHHAAAHAWFASNEPTGWATCPMTQCAFVRISSNPKAVGTPVTPAQAVAALERMTAHPRHVFWADDFQLTSPQRRCAGTNRSLTHICSRYAQAGAAAWQLLTLRSARFPLTRLW